MPRNNNLLEARALLEGRTIDETAALIRAEKRNKCSSKVRVDRTSQPVAYNRAEAKRLARQESELWGWYD
jgi:hypothetical protein